MKKLSTIFPMGENSLGIKNYNHPSKIRKIFIAFVFVFLTGFAFGQNRETVPLKNEVKSVPANATKQSKEKQVNLFKHNEFKTNENLKKNQSLPNRGKQPSKNNSLKNSVNARLGIHGLVEGQSQFNTSDNNAAQKFIDSERPSEKVIANQNQVSNQTPYDGLKNKREDVSKRDLYSKTYVNADGSYTALIGAGPIHYEKNGQFLDIDNKIVQNPNASFPYANSTNLFESYFGANAHNGVKSKTAEGEVLEFLNTKMFWEVNGQAVGVINSQNPAADIQENKVYYHQLFGQISAEYQVLTAKRELNYIIPTRQALGATPANAGYLVFSEDILLPFGWTATHTDRGIVVKDNLGKEIYLYENPVSKDASSELGLSREQNTIFESIQIGQMLTIKTKVKTEWLLSSERVFPVKVDPTTSATANGGRSVYNDGEEENLGYYGRVSIYWLQYHVKFNTSSIPSGSTVSAVEGYFYLWGTAGTRHNSSQWAWANSADPTTTSGTTLYNSATAVQSTPVATNQTAGWKNSTFTATGRTYVSNGINNQNYVAAAVYPYGTWYNNQYYAARTHNDNGLEPYLSITYTSSSGCSGTPNAGEIAVAPHVNNPGQQYVVVAVGYSQGTGIEYRWQKRTSVNYGAWSGWSIVTAFNPTYAPYTATAPASGTREEWRLQVRCTNSNITANSTTDVFYASDCYQGDGFELDPEDGYGITSSENFRVADDFVVPQYSSFSIRTITMDVFTAGTVTNATLNIRKNDGGLPGSVVATRTMTPTRIMRWGDFLGVIPWYRLSFDLVTPINLGTGTYWLEPTVTASGNNTVYWATTYGTTGGVAAVSNDSGATWTPDYDSFYDMVFFVVGDCNSCDAVTASSSSSTVCEGDVVTLSASSSGNYTYHWYLGWNEQNQTFDEDLGTGQTKTVTVDDSAAYWVVATNNTTGCRDYDYVIINVTPPPSLIVMDPVNSITCSNESSEINLVTGGIIPEIILDEKWNPVQNPWIVSTQTWGGSGPFYARWALYDSSPSFHSPDNSRFIMVNSDAYGLYQMESSLITPPMSLLDYNSATTNITLTFNHYFQKNYWGNEEAKIEVTTDGSNWTEIKSYTATVGGATNFEPETINLNAYKGEPYFQLRFRYHANWDYYWAIDDVNITGTNPLPTTVTWSPITGLWFDEARTIPYDGTHALKLYASPSTTTTYTISAKTSVGCPSEEQVTVERGDKDWISPSSTDWNIAANWNEGSVPTADHCVRIPSTSHKPIIDGTTTAFAKNVIIENGGGLTIEGGGSLTVTDYFNHLGTGNEADVVIKHNGNLIQVNDVANTGEITVEKDFKFSADRKQYNYVTAPVVSGRNMKTSIYTPNPTSVQVYNTGNDYFYETPGPYVSGLAYAVKESPGSGTATVAGKLMGVPFNGPLNYTLNTSGNRYNLVGNPYPSNLDIKKLYDNNTTKIESTFYFWDNTSNTLHEQQGSNYNGDHYAKFNAVSNTGTAADCSVYGTGCNKVPDQYVKVGTGFMIQAKTGTLNFTNAYRTTAGNIDFFGKPSGFDTQYDRYWLTMTSPSGTQTMMAVVYFDGGTDEFSADDTKSFQGSNSLFSILDTKQLNIQGRAPFRINDRVPLGYKAFETGTYIIQLEDSDGIFEEGQSIYLIDKLLNKTVKITDKPYKFLTRAGEFNDRFVIVYRPGNIIGTAAEISNQILFAKVDNQIVITSTIDRITEVELFNLNSRSVYKKSDINSNEHRIDALNFNHQIVVVTVKTETGEFVTRKFVNN